MDEPQTPPLHIDEKFEERLRYLRRIAALESELAQARAECATWKALAEDAEALCKRQRNERLTATEQARKEVSDMWLNAVTSVVSAKQAQEISHAILAQRNPCKHTNARCVYDSADGEFERWQCSDCGHRWGVEIPQ